MKHDADTEALEKICGDMDDMESEKMFKKSEEPAKGVNITIAVEPKAEEKKEELAPAPVEDDDSKLPPFLRKKK
jgi:hypothetical protein